MKKLTRTLLLVALFAACGSVAQLRADEASASTPDTGKKFKVTTLFTPKEWKVFREESTEEGTRSWTALSERRPGVGFQDEMNHEAGLTLLSVELERQ